MPANGSRTVSPRHENIRIEPTGQLRRERSGPSSPLGLARPPDIAPDLGEPQVPLRPCILAPPPGGILRRVPPRASLAEEQDELAVEGHVRVRREETGTQERVGPIHRFLPEEVGKGAEPQSDGVLEDPDVVRPETEPVGVRPERIPHIDGHEASGYEDPVSAPPRVAKDPVHPVEVRGPLGGERGVPLRDHRVRGRGHDQVDRSVRDTGERTGRPPR